MAFQLINEVRFKDFRCFKGEQKARLAPLTLLVGENSTGKTSFMAMLRILMDNIGQIRSFPNFKEKPYDLGSFDEIIYRDQTEKNQPKTFEGGFSFAVAEENIHTKVIFGKDKFQPIPIREKLSNDQGVWIESNIQGEKWQLDFGTSNGSWTLSEKQKKENEQGRLHIFLRLRSVFNLLYGPIAQLFFVILDDIFKDKQDGFELTLNNESPQMKKEDIQQIEKIITATHNNFHPLKRPYAFAPVRSKPQRTYDPEQIRWDPEGTHIPMYLSELFLKEPKQWKVLKKNFEDFGKKAGLFDEIKIKHFGKSGIEPFQIQIRKGQKALPRNLVDVGYGVSQTLPLITELLRKQNPRIFLLQQPEVHLHPSVQATFGGLLCEAIEQKKHQVIVETHSDYLLDRVCMDIRDGKTKLKPEDVSVLFFERRKGLEVQIHSLKLKKNGGIDNTPDSYREFFMNETRRALGLTGS